MSLLQKLSISLFVALLAVGFVPLGSFAAGTGSVTISVQNEDGENFSGEWYLHAGTTINGYLVRNGSSGESFGVDSGSYFLEVRNLPNDRPYYLLHSDNPQFIDDGESVLFNVQYFETEEQMLIASGNPPEVEVEAEPVEQTGEGYDIYDEHGCNSTQGYVWCAKNEACVKFWSPACVVEESEPEVVDETPETTTPPTILATSPSVHVPTFETPPSAVVPTFETPPSAFRPDVFDIEAAVAASDDEFQLAQTGPSALLVLIPAGLLGLAVFRRKD